MGLVFCTVLFSLTHVVYPLFKKIKKNIFKVKSYYREQLQIGLNARDLLKIPED